MYAWVCVCVKANHAVHGGSWGISGPGSWIFEHVRETVHGRMCVYVCMPSFPIANNSTLSHNGGSIKLLMDWGAPAEAAFWQLATWKALKSSDGFPWSLKACESVYFTLCILHDMRVIGCSHMSSLWEGFYRYVATLSVTSIHRNAKSTLNAAAWGTIKVPLWVPGCLPPNLQSCTLPSW